MGVLTGGGTRSAPLIGRDEEVAALLPALVAGGCVIAGPVGVGKSRLAAELAARHGRPHLHVLATDAGRSVPFGAFAHLSGGAGIPQHLDAIRSAGGDERPVLVVDDAHLLDEASAALLLAIADSGAATLVATIRHGEVAPDAVTALWKDRGLARFDLAPLSRREVRLLTEAMLEGPVAGEVHRRIYDLSGGAPLYATELVRAGVATGALDRTEDRWTWTDRPLATTRLRELIGARTRHLATDAQRALEMLALCAPLRLEDLVAATGGDSGLDALERARLVAVRDGAGSAEVHLAHPLYGEVLLADLPAAAARRHRRRLAEVLGTRPSASPADLLRRAVLILEAGDHEPDLFMRASAHALSMEAGVPAAWQLREPSLAVRLAEAAGPGLAPALAAARGRLALGEYEGVLATLVPLETEAAGASLRQGESYLRALVYAMHWRGGARPERDALLARARDWHDAPDWQAQHAALEAWISLDDNRPATARRITEPWVARRRELSEAVGLDVLTAHGVALGRLGLTGPCAGLEAPVQRRVALLEAGGCDTGWARYLVDALGRAPAARDLGTLLPRLEAERRRLEEEGRTSLAAALGLVLGRTALLRGHMSDATRRLEEASRDLTVGDARNGLGLALAHLARAHAGSGERAAAEAVLARAIAVARERPDNRYLAAEIEHAAAWLDAARGRLTRARRRLTALADVTGEASVQEAEARYGAIRLGAPARDLAPRLRQLADEADSDLLDAFADHATAVADADADAEMAAAERLAGLCLDLPAAEAAAGAARSFRREGRASSARRAEALARAWAERCPGARTPGLGAVPEADALTPREHEVALLAASGHSNARIAEALVLSVRSVETYVLRACRKLGAAGREELAALLPSGGGRSGG